MPGEIDGVCLDVPQVDLASLTVDEEKGGLDRIFRQTDLVGPDIGGSTGDESDDTAATLGRHDAIDDLIEGSVAPIADHEIIVLLGRFARQLHRVPAEFLEGDIRLPARRGE